MSSNNQQAGPATSSSNPFLESYRAWSERTPFFTRFTTISIIVVYILSFFISLDRWLANIPYYSIQYGEVYRIVLSPLVGNSLLFLLIMLLSFPAVGMRMESTMGSASFLTLMLTIDLMINISFILLCYVLFWTGSVDHTVLRWSCADFWTILFALLSIDCFLVIHIFLFLSSCSSFSCFLFYRILMQVGDCFVFLGKFLQNIFLSLSML
jgi:hypothetical protein